MWPSSRSARGFKTMVLLQMDQTKPFDELLTFSRLCQKIEFFRVRPPAEDPVHGECDALCSARDAPGREVARAPDPHHDVPTSS